MMAIVWVVLAAAGSPLVVFTWVKTRAHPVLVSVWVPEVPVPTLEARQVMPLELVIEPAAIIPPPRRELGQ